MSTVADMAGVPAPMRSDGRSLLHEMRGQKANKPSTVYAEYNVGGGMAQYKDYAPNKKGRVRGEQQILFFPYKGKSYKAIRTDIKTGLEDFEVYEVDADSHETQDLAGDKRFDSSLQNHLRAMALYQRRAYDDRRDGARYGRRASGCEGFRSYDKLLVPALQVQPPGRGLRLRQVHAPCAGVPQFDTLPGAAQAESSIIYDPATLELPAGSVTELKGYIHVPHDAEDWHFFLRLNEVEGSKAFVRMHNFNLIDADKNYRPGSEATVSSAANADEAIEGETGKKGIPLTKGTHPVSIVVVQGPSGPGKLELQWQQGGGEKKVIPATRFFH